MSGFDEIRAFFTKKTAVKELEAKIDANPYYPFTRIGDNRFTLSITPVEKYYGIAMIVFSVLLLAVLLLFFSIQSFLTPLAIYIIVYGLCLTLANRSKRTYFLDGNENILVFTCGARVVEVKLHNVYIRMRRQGVRAGGLRFALLFGGARIETEMLSRPTTQAMHLRKIGQALAGRLNLNYFDDGNCSKEHRVIHGRLAQGLGGDDAV